MKRIHNSDCSIFIRPYPLGECNCDAVDVPLSDPNAVVIECEPHLLGLPPVFAEGSAAERYPDAVAAAVERRVAPLAEELKKIVDMEATMAGEFMEITHSLGNVAVNPVQPRFCINCKHHQEDFADLHICDRPMFDLVTGISRPNGNKCADERALLWSGDCGPGARFFEPKP